MQKSMVMFNLSIFDWKYLFGQIWFKKSNCQYELKFGTRLIWICGIEWWCSLFQFLTENTFFGKIWSKKWKFTILSWDFALDYFKYAELCRKYVVLTFFCFRPNLVKKNKSCQFKLIFGTKTNSNTQNLMMIFPFLTINIFLGQIWAKNSKLFVQS